MSLRLRLIVAFFLLSVVPLGAVTFYSYANNVRALQQAAQHETEMLTTELTQRMQVVTAQISDRVQRLMDMPVVASTAVATGTAGTTTSSSSHTVVARTSPVPKSAATAPKPAATASKPAATAAAATRSSAPSAQPDTAAGPRAIEQQVASSLGEVAMLLNNVEVRGTGRYSGLAAPGAATSVGVGAGRGAGGRTPPGAEPDRHRPFPSDGSMGRDGGRGRGFRPPVEHGDSGPSSGAPATPTPPIPPSAPPNVLFPDP